MNYAIFIIFQIVVFIIFAYCFFKGKYDNVPEITTIILWFVVLVLSGTLMMSSWNVERYSWVPANTTLSGTDIYYYDSVVQTDQWEAVGGINILIFSLSLIFTLNDLITFGRSVKASDT